MNNSIYLKLFIFIILLISVTGCASNGKNRTTEDLFNRLAEIRKMGIEKDVKAVKYLIDEFENSNSDVVRIEAAKSLGKIGDPRALDSLRRTLQVEKKQNILSEARDAIAQIEKQVAQQEKQNK